jgi:hypothetical protein
MVAGLLRNWDGGKARLTKKEGPNLDDHNQELGPVLSLRGFGWSVSSRGEV